MSLFIFNLFIAINNNKMKMFDNAFLFHQKIGKIFLKIFFDEISYLKQCFEKLNIR